jgi:hypothetical protein
MNTFSENMQHEWPLIATKVFISQDLTVRFHCRVISLEADHLSDSCIHTGFLYQLSIFFSFLLMDDTS